MVTGKTESGFEFEINEAQLDDMEFMEALSDVQDDPLAFPKVCRMLLGEEQKKKLYEHLRDENGKVPIAAVNEAITEIMTVSGEKLKNS